MMYRFLMAMGMIWCLAACSPRPINSPYQPEALAQNTLFTAFTQRSPKHLDPARSYSSDETPFTYSIYEPLYGYDYLQRPYVLIPKTAVDVVSPRYYDAQGNVLPDDVPGEQVVTSIYDIKIKPGIRFQPHPSLALDDQGKPRYWPLKEGELQEKYGMADFEHAGTRELVAADYVYAWKRLASPRVASPIYGVFAEHVVDMKDFGERLKEHIQQSGLPADEWLDLRELEFDGVQALDDHTLRIKVLGKYPQFKYWLAMTFSAPIPWEAERFYSQPGMAEHDLSLNTWPVGTGPYMLSESLVNRRHVLTRNPYFRGEPYPCIGEPQDKQDGLLADCGKLTPFVDRVEFLLEKESVPLMGKFLQGYYDIPQIERGEYGVAMRVAAGDSTEKATLYNEHGIVLRSSTEAQYFYLGFNWLDPVVGNVGSPEQQEKNRKLRHAISIAFDWEQFVSIFQNGEAQVSHGPVPPGVPGYEPLPEGRNPVVYELVDGRVERRDLSVARQLLREAGYPDGRDAQTGRPLILNYDSAGGMGSSAMLDWMRRQLASINVQLEIRATDYNRFQDKMRQGSAQMFMWGWLADYPDAENFLFLLYGPNGKVEKGGENASNYENSRFDELFERMRFLNDGPEKDALIREMVAIVQQDAPWMFGYIPKSGGAYQQWVGNAKPSQMVRDTLQYYRIDPALRAQKIKDWNAPQWGALWWVAGLLVALVATVLVLVRRRAKATALTASTGRQP
jgi:ABC-type transport system substrate-binding protein